MSLSRISIVLCNASFQNKNISECRSVDCAPQDARAPLLVGIKRSRIADATASSVERLLEGLWVREPSHLGLGHDEEQALRQRLRVVRADDQHEVVPAAAKGHHRGVWVTSPRLLRGEVGKRESVSEVACSANLAIVVDTTRTKRCLF